MTGVPGDLDWNNLASFFEKIVNLIIRFFYVHFPSSRFPTLKTQHITFSSLFSLPTKQTVEALWWDEIRPTLLK